MNLHWAAFVSDVLRCVGVVWIVKNDMAWFELDAGDMCSRAMV